jgi:hypothetical protein
MKKLLLTLGIAVTSYFSYGQNTPWAQSGPVGIGTITPSTTLDVGGVPNVVGSAANVAIRAGADMNLLLGGSGTPGTFFIRAGLDNNTNYSSLTMQGNPLILNPYGSGQNVGIGTTSPFAKLTIPNASAPNGGYLGFDVATNGASRRWWISPDIISFGDFGIQTESTKGNANSDLTRFYINPSGKVGIGTISPDEKLTVKGNILAAEVRVEEYSTIPDYVFGPDYKLTSLEELKAYVDQNHHLPEIPSAKEIEKDGLKLGDMSLKLLKTIEELTLHVIELNNQVKLQNEKIISLENQIKK